MSGTSLFNKIPPEMLLNLTPFVFANFLDVRTAAIMETTVICLKIVSARFQTDLAAAAVYAVIEPLLCFAVGGDGVDLTKTNQYRGYKESKWKSALV